MGNRDAAARGARESDEGNSSGKKVIIYFIHNHVELDIKIFLLKGQSCKNETFM